MAATILVKWAKSTESQKELKISGKERHININLFGRCPSGGEGVSRSGVQGSEIYVPSSEPKEHREGR